MVPFFWDYIYRNFEQHEIMLLTVAVLLLSEIPIFIFTLLDLLKLECLKKYRICYTKDRAYPDLNDIIHCMKHSYISIFKIYVPMIIIGAYLCKFFNFYPYSMNRELPSITNGVIELFIITIFGDILFYILHRIFHNPYLYKKYHKKHHEYQFTFAMVHHYLHDVEAFIFIFPALIPPLIFHSHIVIMWFWMIISQTVGIIGHSGYFIPFPFYKYFPTLRAEYHDTHHYLFNKNFGLIYIFTDILFGTYSLPNIHHIHDKTQ